MFFLTGILLFGLFCASLILPWVLLGRIKYLEQEIKRLNDHVNWLISYARGKGAAPPVQEEKLSQPSPFKQDTTPITEKSILDEAREKLPFFAQSKVEPKASQKKAVPIAAKQSFEQRYLVSLPVWIGAIALALSGAFLVKYSIEMGFLSPGVRILIGLLFGLALLFLAYWLQEKKHIANGVRISQALSGAGIADLYVCLFTATSFYHLVPAPIGFVGMAAVTATAVVLSLKQGPPIALIGMIGGFLTPALIHSDEPNALILFLYLYFVLAGLFTVIRLRNWWFISIPVVLGTFAWVIFWLATSSSPNDSLWLGLFLIAVSGTIVFHSKQAMETQAPQKSGAFPLFPTLNYLSLGGAIILMSVIAAKAHFGGLEWGLFWLLAAGGIILSYYNQKFYGFIPWLSLAIAVLMIVVWQEKDPNMLASVLLAFALLYALSGYWFMWRSNNPVPWSMLGAGSSFLFYVTGYGKFHHWFGEKHIFFQDPVMDTHFWGILAFVLFVLSTLALMQVLNRFADTEDSKQRLLTVFTLTASAFLFISFAIELDKEFLTIALSAEILAVSWINGYVRIKALRPIAGALAIIFGILLLPEILFQISLLSTGLGGWFSKFQYSAQIFHTSPQLLAYLQSKIPTINWSLSHLGLPAFLFGLSSVLFHRQKDDYLVRGFEMVAVGLITIMTYYFCRHGFHINENLLMATSTFIERGVLTNIYFLYGFVCLWLGKKFDREGLFLSGIALICLALLRILFFDLLIYNPLWSSQDVGSFPLFNGLLLPYGLPILWLMLADKEFTPRLKEEYSHYINVILLILLFFFVSFNVRQIYHGAYLDRDIMSNGEVYTYSVVWLLTGLTLLFFGTLRQNKTLRLASLAFMILTVSKVFLYDAAELTGLLRVFSFLGLGISLLGLSWFYARFVFKQRI